MTGGSENARLIATLRREGIRDEAVLAAMAAVPREVFVDPSFADQAYADMALPIDCGQTISQPFVVAYMTEKLELNERMTVLEVGTGSGYQAAVLAQLARHVYTIERYETLLKAAEARFRQLDISNITARFGDGMEGWPEKAPFDRILVTAGAEEVPQPLFEQLADGGVMVLPLGPSFDVQTITRVRRENGAMMTEKLHPVRFVPLVAGAVRAGGGATGPDD